MGVMLELQKETHIRVGTWHGSVNRHIIATMRCERSKNGGRCYVLMDLIETLASYNTS